MFGLGPTEFVVIFALALIIFGPSKLAELTKTLGKAINDFKETSNKAKETINQSLAQAKEEKNKKPEKKDGL